MNNNTHHNKNANGNNNDNNPKPPTRSPGVKAFPVNLIEPKKASQAGEGPPFSDHTMGEISTQATKPLYSTRRETVPTCWFQSTCRGQSRCCCNRGVEYRWVRSKGKKIPTQTKKKKKKKKKKPGVEIVAAVVEAQPALPPVLALGSGKGR